ncbi:MAG: molybdopterin biosynthesis protein [Chloroflexota bacterium]
MSKEATFIQDVPLDDAKSKFFRALSEINILDPMDGELVDLSDSIDRVTSVPVFARLSSPHYHASAMDGYGVRSKDTQGATETRPIRIKVLETDDLQDSDDTSRTVAINTGQPLPDWADAVIMIEHVQPLDISGLPIGRSEKPACIEIMESVSPWQHVRPMGEDMVATELVLPANHKIRPVDIGAIAASGYARVEVRRKPNVTVIPTGNELVQVYDSIKPLPGEILESNSLVLAAQIERWGAIATRHPIVPDRVKELKQAVKAACGKSDLVIVNAGSSAGTKDYTASVVQDLGELFVHGIAIRPGHPVILGVVSNTPVIGIPGYPVSAALTSELLIQPLIRRWLNQAQNESWRINAKLSHRVLSPIGVDEFLRVAVGNVGDQVLAFPLSRGAGTITSLVRADGIVRIPRSSEGFDSGAKVAVELFGYPQIVGSTIVITGSHDLIIDLLADRVPQFACGSRIISASVGSLGGLVAINNNQAHLAGCHLLDPETGEYNTSYVKRYVPNNRLAMVTLVERQQGLILPSDNPRNLHDWKDLSGDGVTFINRQRGSGTRILTDYWCRKNEISTSSITGYDRNAFTHLEVAAAVASGSADVGVGIRAAADALGLDFVPLADEVYELAIPMRYFQDPLLDPIHELLQDSEFRGFVDGMKGYSARNMGKIRRIET